MGLEGWICGNVVQISLQKGCPEGQPFCVNLVKEVILDILLAKQIASSMRVFTVFLP